MLILAMLAGWMMWLVLGPGTGFAEEKKVLFIKSGTAYTELCRQLEKEEIVRSPRVFNWVSSMTWSKKEVKAGRYQIKKGTSLVDLIGMLRAGKQAPVKLVINKLRTREDLARKIGTQFDTDSGTIMQIINDSGFLRSLQVDTGTFMTLVIPNTYEIFWNTPPRKIIGRLAEEQKKFWTDTRRQKAAALNLNAQTAYTLASIVEEETNKEEDKGKIASVYLNRIETGMKLGADPTVKYATRDFGLKRILHKHLEFPSAYNTYLHAGLPPGPICTPSVNTLDAVLNAPSTSYLYFVAKPDFKGYSNFATTYTEHLEYARQYQQALDKLMQEKAQKEKKAAP